MVLVPPAVVLNLDPLSIWFPTNCEDCITRRITLYTVRIIILTLIGVEVTKTLLAFLIVGLIVLFAAAEGACILDNCIKFSSKIRIVRCYQEFQIWNQHTNTLFCYQAIPPLIFFGIVIVIIVNYATIRLFGVLPGMIYPVAPFTSLVAAVTFMTLLPQAAETHKNSSRFLASVKSHLCERKYDRKVAYSLRPIGARCGPFGIITNKWVSKFLETDLNYTFTALLTF